ncbi:MAG: cytochrome c oxidase subunit II [Planctomycetaceae bacterium]
MKKFWAIFFWFWPLVALWLCAVAPANNWWFPSPPLSTLGHQIDGLFYLILIIVAVTFIGTQFALGYALWKGATKGSGDKAWFSHGSHRLEIIWTIVPAFILVFISLTQLDVLAEIRVISHFPKEARKAPAAEVMARQFEWRIRYARPGTELMNEPRPGDLYYVNEVHVPAVQPTMINLRTQDVQHAFFVPRLRVKQDAVPGLIIPVWFEIEQAGEYELLCAELCGWGHYKMKARIIAETPEQVQAYLSRLEQEQNEDGVADEQSSQ